MILEVIVNTQIAASRPLPPSVAKVMGWDLSKPREYLRTKEGLTEKELRALEVEYKKFLGIIIHYPGRPFPISSAVDRMWHAHVLFTKDYNTMGMACAGRLIDHSPAVSETDRERLAKAYFANTLPCLEELYGEKPNEIFWARNTQVCKECCCSNDCPD